MTGADAARIVGVVVGVALFGLGLWAVRLSKRDIRADGAHDNSTPTRLTDGMTCLFWGYHAVVWSLPMASPLICVPLNWWWLVVAVGVVAGLGARLAEWIEDREH